MVEMLPSNILVDFARVIDVAIVLLDTDAEAPVVPPATVDAIEEPEICAKASLPKFSSADAITAFDVEPVPMANDKSKLAVAVLPRPVAVIAFANKSVVIAPFAPFADEVTLPLVIIASISPDPS